MSYTLAINANNVIGSNNNTYQYKFIQGSFSAKDCEISVGSLIIPYSWFNITSAYNNNTISITFPYLATTTTLSIVLPDGFYSVSDINNYIQLQMINSGLYLKSSSGQYVYFFNMATNSTYYNIQITLSLVPTTVASGDYLGYSLPTTGFWSIVATNGLPTTTKTPSFSFASSGSIASVVGFTTGSYASSTTTSLSYNGTLTPLLTNVNALLCRCNLVNNNITMPSDVVDLIPINSTFGSNINYLPSIEKFVDIRDGTYSSLTITFTDQSLNTLYAKDPNLAMTLHIRKKR